MAWWLKNVNAYFRENRLVISLLDSKLNEEGLFCRKLFLIAKVRCYKIPQ